jgi:hypothetical protein
MAKLIWDTPGQRLFETGVSKGVLYVPNAQGLYTTGYAWNGLTGVTETPSGAEASPQYADNIKWLNMYSAEEFGATLEAFMYPDQFAQFDGAAIPAGAPGITVGQQSRKVFGLSYQTILGNDIDGNDHGYKIHLVYGCQASPSERAYATVNDSPEAITFSWELTTTPVAATGFKPTSILTITSTKVAPASLVALEDLLYGTQSASPVLPLPDQVIGLLTATLQTVTPTKPTQVGNVVTIPTQTGVEYWLEGIELAAGALTLTEDVLISASPAVGYTFPSNVDSDWGFDFT